MFAVLAFKIYITRTFLPAFQYYIPTDEELRQAAVHSKRSDNLNNKLEKRFGHPALHQDLFTPMVHANMTHLLAEVFEGKIGSTKTALDDLGGNKVDAAVVGGVRIAGIEEVRRRMRVLRLARFADMYYSTTWSMTRSSISATGASSIGTSVRCRLRHC